MYVAGVPRFPYRDPWTASFAERRAALLTGNPRIAYYYTLPDTSTFRYRAFNMIEALAFAEPDASASWITASDGSRAVELVEDVDVLVVCRALYGPHIAAVIARARALGKRILFDVDDLIFDDRYAHLIMETLDQKTDEAGLQAWFGWIARCGATMRLCDGVITTNEFLAERVLRFSGLPTSVVPNFLNSMQMGLSERIREAKAASGWTRDGRIHLGYFSGTPTHVRDFAIVEPTIAALLESDERVHVRVVGFPPQSDLLAPYAGRIETIPLQDFLNLQRFIGDVEINIVPLQDNEFTNCKSELKYFEAAVVGTVTVASPSYTLRRAIEDGVNGFCSTSHEWLDVLRSSIESIDDLPVFAETAAEDAIRRYSPRAQSSALRAALFAESPERQEDVGMAVSAPETSS
jgi:hypothetical protein